MDGIATSSFNEKVDHLLSNSSINNDIQKKADTTPTLQPQTVTYPSGSNPIDRMNQRKDTSELKGSVADFFSNIDDRFRQHTNQMDNYNHLDNLFGRNEQQPRLNIYGEQLNRMHEEILPRQPAPVQSPCFRPDCYYKIRQKWNLSVHLTTSLGTTATNVHDFIYRLEQMAIDGNIPQEQLPKLLYLFLSKTAEDWYWVFKSNHPVATWAQMKTAILSYFSSSNYEEEIKENILKRMQGVKESFSNFALTIQKMNARLQDRLSERQLIYRLCQNMYPALKNVTLPYHNSIRTVEELRDLCREYEHLWDQTGYDPRKFFDSHHHDRRSKINEITKDLDNLNIDKLINLSFSSGNDTHNVSKNFETLEAFNSRNRYRQYESTPGHQSNSISVCWNCKDFGHRYEDCLKPFLDIFCFGCGAANV